MRLNYSSYESIIKDCFEQGFDRGDLALLLLSAAFDDNTHTDLNTVVEGSGSRYRKGTRDISRHIRKHYYRNNQEQDRKIHAKVKQHFADKIVIGLKKEREHIDALLERYRELISGDGEIPAETRATLLALATPDTLNDFLAETFIYAVKQNNKTEENSDIPANQSIEHHSITRGVDITCSKYYVERQELMDICELIESGEKRILINGMGGNGKTEICRQIYHRLREKLPLIECAGYFIYDASMDETLYGALDFEKSGDKPEDIEKAWRTLESLRDKKAIIFIDNLPEDAPQKDVSFQKLYSLDCAVVVTSRVEEIDRFKAIKIGFMETAQCKELFQNIYDQEINELELVDLEYIVSQVAFRHVLTVKILAYACKQNVYSLSRLRMELDRIGFHLRFMDVDDAKSKKMIIEKYEQLFDLLRLTKGEQNILETFSLFPYMPLDIDLCEKLLLRDANKEDPDGDYDRLTFSDISDRGWLERSGNGFALHPLIAEMIYERNVKLRQDYMAHIELIKVYIDAIDINSFEIFGKEMPSLAFADSICEKLYGYLDENLAYIIYALAGKYQLDYQNSDSLKWYLRLENADEALLGEYSYLMIDVYSSMADIYCGEREYEKSLVCCKMALEKREKVKIGSETGMDVVNWRMANTYHNMGEYDNALKYFSMVLETRKRVLGVDNPDTTLIYQHIAYVYIDKEDYDKALEYCNLSIEAAKNVPGKNNYYLINAYTILSLVCRKKMKYDESLECLSLALDNAENILDLPTTNIATSIAYVHLNMGEIYIEKGEYNRTLEHYALALQIREKVMGDCHPDTLQIIDSMAIVYGMMGDYEKALEYCQSNLRRRRQELGENHPRMMDSYNALATIYYRKGEYDDALEYYALSLNIEEKKFGINHPVTLRTYNNIAKAYRNKGDYDNAVKYFAKALGKQPFETIGIHEEMAKRYQAAGELDEALKCFSLSLAARNAV